MKKYLPYIILGTAVLGVAGYFTWRHFKYATGDPSKNSLKIKILNRG